MVILCLYVRKELFLSYIFTVIFFKLEFFNRAYHEWLRVFTQFNSGTKKAAQAANNKIARISSFSSLPCIGLPCRQGKT